MKNNHPAAGLEFENQETDLNSDALEAFVHSWIIKIGYGDKATNFKDAFTLIEKTLEQNQKMREALETVVNYCVNLNDFGDIERVAMEALEETDQ